MAALSLKLHAPDRKRVKGISDYFMIIIKELQVYWVFTRLLSYADKELTNSHALDVVQLSCEIYFTTLYSYTYTYSVQLEDEKLLFLGLRKKATKISQP